ncbi:MAG: flagellar hook-length control protein FliK [Candidatus Azotimanducaceae bacterium]|jgi:flagellar hook-length control protein FliK
MAPYLSSDKILLSGSAPKPPEKPNISDKSNHFSRVIAAETHGKNTEKQVSDEKSVSKNGKSQANSGKDSPPTEEVGAGKESIDLLEEVLGDETILFSVIQENPIFVKGISSIDLSTTVAKDTILANTNMLSEKIELTLLNIGALAKGASEGKPDQSVMPLALTQLSDINLANLQKTELSVPVKVSSPDWGEALAGRISLLVNQRISSARIQLTPPELGPIEVRVNLNNEQASVQFLSHSGQVRDALEQAIPRLREMLESSGFSLADAHVGQDGKQRDQSDAEGREGDEGHDESLNQHLSSEIPLGLIDDYV